jgi:hypothetical protein
MKRRDFVKAMVAASASMSAQTVLGQQASAPSQAAAAPAAAAPAAAASTALPKVAAAPVPWMEGLMQMKPLPMGSLSPDSVAATNSNFFSAKQLATLKRFSEILMPPLSGYPGATEAGTAEFLDFLIGASPVDRQKLYQSGLDWLESEAAQHFGISFGAVNADQADQLIRPWLRTWMSDHPPTEPHADFVNIAHADIRTATMNSQAWSDAARTAGKRAPNTDVYWYPVDPDLRREAGNCVPPGHRLS